MFIYLREPEATESDSWQLAVQTIDAIIWSVEPRSSATEQSELRDRLPDVQKQIELACETLGRYGSTNNESQLALIRDIQEAILRQPVSETSRQQPLAAQPSDVAAEATGIENNTAEPAQEAAVEKPSPEVEAAISELKKIAFGTWFTIQEDEESLPVRHKLSWYSHMSGNYMFVDSMGMRAKVRKQAELATLMATGKARIIEDEQYPLVQRALEAIRRMLGGEQKVPA